MKPLLNRRQFLKWMGLSGLSLLLTKCGFGPIPTLEPTLTGAPSPLPSDTPFPPPTATTALLPTATLPPAPSATPSYKALTAIGRATTYDVAVLRRELETMFDGLGGLGDIIRPGARVALKPNLTGGTWTDSTLPAPATELFATHPALVQALAELLIDAGAGHIRIMDGLGDEAIFHAWGYQDAAARVNAELVDLCKTSPYNDFIPFPVGPNRQVYDVFYLNPTLHEADVFISVAKMKCHSTTGVTLALKNLIGIAPTSRYRRLDKDNNRSAFHESTVFDHRLPRVVVDLNLARPVHLALIDGVMTVEAGAGAWDAGYNPVKPGLLVAGKNPVATDAVCAAIMGFDPDAPSGTQPFAYADNHLALARDAGLGTNRLDEIGVVGPSIAEVAFPFKMVR
ncbi:MAG: DUF362 domain-containing protein [Anaerolineales bacterium]